MVKISIMGAGELGSHIALFCALKELGDEVWLFSRDKDRAEGHSMDISQALSVYSQDVRVHGTNDYRFLEGSDIVVIAVGKRRKTGMIRADLYESNYPMVKESAERIKKYCPNSIVIVVSNPLDSMTYVTHQVLQNPRKVIGMGNSLDTARFREIISQESGIPRSSIFCMVTGMRDHDMQDHAYKFKTENMVQRSKSLAIDTITKKGSTVFAPAIATTQIIEAIVCNSKLMTPVSFYHDSEDVCYGEIAVIGRGGIES